MVLMLESNVLGKAVHGKVPVDTDLIVIPVLHDAFHEKVAFVMV
jgi:hypothetical protein